MKPIKIAIIGAGPAGCTLARILTQSKVSSSLSITIFEGEKSMNVRSQGGTLDLHQGSGLDAIRAANLVTEFEKYARYDGESLVLSDKYLTKYIDMAGDKSEVTNKNARAPEIDRFRLRQLLLDSLPEGIIQWGRRLAEIREEEASGVYTLHFVDGTTASGFDLVVGADGAWSKVRPLVSDAQPFFSGVVGYSLTIAEASKVAPETVELVNGGSVMSPHDHTFLSQQRMGDDVLQATAYWVVDKGDERWMQKTAHDSKDLEAVKRYLLTEKLNGWNPKLTNAIEKASPATTTHRSESLYMLPVGHSWKHRHGVTLVGDAAHLMTPFAGEGVNQGLTDAKILAEEIIRGLSSGSSSNSSDLDAAVIRFEKEMFTRSAAIMEMTEKMKDLVLFRPGGLYKNIEEFLVTAMSDELPMKTISIPIVRAATYVYYFFWRLWKQPKP